MKKEKIVCPNCGSKKLSLQPKNSEGQKLKCKKCKTIVEVKNGFNK